ncbi:hypothetical protein P3W45_000433 [Vairimorpha bombi]|jgi:hypothetical protein
MIFSEYINKLKKSYTLTRVNDTEYILHKDKKTLRITPLEMYSEEEINIKLRELYPSFVVEEKYSHLGEEKHSHLGEEKYSHLGEDDLHPPVGRRPGKPKGSIFSPEDLEETMISKSEIFPLKKKKDPDDDHFKKDGGDDDNMFMY